MYRARKKNLSCFYCGRRSDISFNGQASFLCKNCEAMNWLDKDGSITDPPTSTNSTSDGAPEEVVQYAVPRTSRARPMTPATSSDAFRTSDSIFCTKCQRNQEHLARTLKEYELPDDPNDPEYGARLRSYRRWKQDLEARYPPVCAECEPKVQQQLQKSSYKAKTDHLRRMMDRTRAQRHGGEKRGVLDIMDAAGRWTWHIAFALQFIWHVAVLGGHFVEQGQGPAGNWAIASLRKICQLGLEHSPKPERLIRWGISMSLVSSPWNPRFKQTVHGFTSHLLGLRQWYTYQLVIILIRCACLFISQYNDTKGIPAMKQLGAHLVIGWLMVYVYENAGKTIRTDTAPLFGSGQQPQPPEEEMQPMLHKESNDLGDLLDEIARSPTEKMSPSPSHPSNFSPRQLSSTNTIIQDGSFAAPMRQARTGLGMDSLNLSGSPVSRRHVQQPVQYDDEMDWTPSGSQHRAFSTHNPYIVKNPNPRFNDTPIEPKPGPFWYKVPPAPITPAQRLRNPPMRPIIRESAKESKENFFMGSTRGSLELGTGAKDAGSGMILKDPQFYAPGPRDDPRDGLSNMMGSFSISPSPDDKATRVQLGNAAYAPNGERGEIQNNSRVRMAELLVLFGALWAWVTALGTQETYGPTLALGAICACLMVSIRLAADLLVDAQIKEGKQPSVFRLSWANLGLAQVVAALILGWKVWAGTESGRGVTCGVYGNALLGVVIAHQVWHVFG
ncbi:Ima1 N-terminal domain-containing protein [Xylariales sp. AK1849]|nr:Ima1 N-terminal domain-containing protein [Xylariales sp. AK1849]